MINNKFFANTESNVSQKRIKQLRTIVEGTYESLEGDIHPEDRKELIKQNKDYSRAEISDILENPENKINKTEGKKLAIFLKNYISSLNPLEYNKLYRVLNSILLYNKSKDSTMEEYFDLLRSDDATIFDSLYKLISEKALFPKTETQEEFNKEFKSILYRYLNKTQKDAKNESFFINEVDTDLILTYMSESEIYRTTGSIEMDGGLNWFKYNINIKDSESNNNIDNFNDFSYEISFGKIGENGISRDKFMDYIKSKGLNEIKQNIYYLGGNRNFNVHMEVKERFINNGFAVNGSDSKEVFVVEFFLLQKTELSTFDYFSYGSDILNKEVTEFMSKLYRFLPIFPSAKNFIDIDHDDIYDKIYTDEAGDKESKQKTMLYRGNSKTPNDTISKNNVVQKYKYTLDDIILEDEERDELKMLLEIFKNPEHFEKFGIGLPKGTILYGPPGNGKTLSAKILASESGAKFMYIKDTDIHVMWVGESARNLQNKFDEARTEAAKGNKVVIFIDEADVIFQKRTDIQNHKEGMISVLLQAMDGFDENATKNIFIILGTNVFENLDPAIRSRFDKKIKYNNPSEKNRVRHLKLQMNKWIKKSTEQLFEDNIDLEKISKNLDGKSGRFIEKLIKNTISEFAFKRLTNDGFLITTEDIIKSIRFTKENEEETKEKVMGFGRHET